jgi:hypothetical protein
MPADGLTKRLAGSKHTAFIKALGMEDAADRLESGKEADSDDGDSGSGSDNDSRQA